MRLNILALIVFTGFSFTKTTGQSTLAKNTFIINGQIANRDTGLVALWYYDQYNKTHPDTFRLDKGRFKFSGSVNVVSEALLWTDLKNRNFDDPTVIRFLLESGKIVMHKKNDKSPAIIKGSGSQQEKEAWDKQKSSLLIIKERCYDTYFDLRKQPKTVDSIVLQKQLEKLSGRIDSVNARLLTLDLHFINHHPDSYLSASLLSKHQRKLPVDTLEILYHKLTSKVRKTGLGHDVLAYIYPITNNNKFRMLHPLFDAEFDQQLGRIHSIYDLALKDTLGNTFDLKRFKGKYVLIDFWGTWCRPCIANIPALNQVINEYNRDSIQVVSISLDKDADTWKNSIVKYNFPGLQLSDLKGTEGLGAIYCKVLWVPTYIIVDKNGKIINYHAPQASEPELKEILSTLLRPNVFVEAP